MSDRRFPEHRSPTWTVDQEELAAKVAAMDEHDLPADKALAIAAKAVRGLRADEHSGEQIWTTVAGLEVRGAAGRHVVVGELVAELRLASYGPDPLETSAKMLQERGVTRVEGLAHLQHRLRRLPDGQIQWSPGGGQRIRVGGDEVVLEAVRAAHQAIQKARTADPGGAIEADVQQRHRFSV